MITLTKDQEDFLLACEELGYMESDESANRIFYPREANNAMNKAGKSIKIKDLRAVGIALLSVGVNVLPGDV